MRLRKLARLAVALSAVALAVLAPPLASAAPGDHAHVLAGGQPTNV